MTHLKKMIEVQPNLHKLDFDASTVSNTLKNGLKYELQSSLFKAVVNFEQNLGSYILFFPLGMPWHTCSPVVLDLYLSQSYNLCSTC